MDYSLIRSLSNSIKDSFYSAIMSVCKMGKLSSPSGKSGVVVGGKTYNTFSDIGGSIYYIDDNGRKVYVDESKDTFKDIRPYNTESVLRCYYVSEDKEALVMEVYSFNENLDVLKKTYNVIYSDDPSIVPGFIDSILPTWIVKRCNDDRFVSMYTEECYGNPLNDVVKFGVYRVLHKDKGEVLTQYSVISSEISSLSVGSKHLTIPGGLTKIECIS